MKKRLTSPTFDASEQTIEHASFSDVGLSGIQLIVNVTDQIIIYNFADTAKGGALVGDVLTLEHDTTTMDDADELMVLVEDGVDSVAIDDGGNTITVDGTVTANLSATDNAVLDDIAADTESIKGYTDGIETLLGTIDADTGAIKTAVEIIDNAISGSEMQVDVVASLPAGSNAIGKLAANSGVDIGDVDVTSIVPGTAATNLGKAEDAAHSSGDTGVMALAVRDDDPVAATSGATGDYEPLHTDARGILWARNVPDTTDLANLGGEHVKKYYTASAPTDGIIWSPAAGKRWYVTDIFINVSAASTVTLEDDKAGGDDVVWKAELAANSGWSHSFKIPLYSGEDAADLTITASAGTVYVTVTGYEI